MIIKHGYLVLSCGCTDCFPAAIFFTNHDAHQYGKEHCSFNPDGYLVQFIDISKLGLQDD